MNCTGTAVAVALTLLLAVTGALAQPAADNAEAAPGPDTIPKADIEKSTGNTENATETPARAGKSPSDYRASEEISEDLPVSFPVDI